MIKITVFQHTRLTSYCADRHTVVPHATLNICSLATEVDGADKYFRAAGSSVGYWLQCQYAQMSVVRDTRGSFR